MNGGSPAVQVKWNLPVVHLARRDDLVSLYIEALTNSAYDGSFNATAPNPVRMAELCSVLGNSLGRPSWLPVPSFAIQVCPSPSKATTGLRLGKVACIACKVVRAGIRHVGRVSLHVVGREGVCTRQWNTELCSTLPFPEQQVSLHAAASSCAGEPCAIGYMQLLPARTPSHLSLVRGCVAQHRRCRTTDKPFLLQALLGAGASVVLEGQRVLPSKTVDSGFQFEYEAIDPAIKQILASS